MAAQKNDVQLAYRPDDPYWSYFNNMSLVRIEKLDVLVGEQRGLS